MRNKILIVDANGGDLKLFEECFQEIVDEGGELLFTEKREEGLALIKKERPQLVFIDEVLAHDLKEWQSEKSHCVLISDKTASGGDRLVRPFTRHQVLEKCEPFLKRAKALPLPPM